MEARALRQDRLPYGGGEALIQGIVQDERTDTFLDSEIKSKSLSEGEKQVM